MRLRALRPWYNPDHEGQVEPGQCFEASEYRSRDLIRAGLAMVDPDENQKITVPHDPPRRTIDLPFTPEQVRNGTARGRGRAHRREE